MEFINFIFRLGVVFAIFAFIWFFISLGIKLLTGGMSRKATGEVYLLKAIQYYFLVNVTFLICYNQYYSGMDVNQQLVMGGVILAMYFLGKFQNGQKKNRLIQFYANGVQTNMANQFNAKYELGVIALAIGIFTLFCFYPTYAETAIAMSIKGAIINIEDTPIFGFVFKVVGFFFLISVLNKVINTIMLLITGQLFRTVSDSNQNPFDNHNDRSENDFDDYEEIKDELNP